METSDRMPGGGFLTTAKDRLLATGVKARLNKLIRDYGTMLDFRLSTADHSFAVSLLLKGEESPIEIRIHEYVLVESEGKTWIQIDGRKVETSREWLTKFIRDQVDRQKLFVPEQLAWLVQLLR